MMNQATMLSVLFLAATSVHGFQNPVLTSTKPLNGLSILKVDNVFFMQTSNDTNIYLRRSMDLQTWEDPISVMGPDQNIPWLSEDDVFSYTASETYSFRNVYYIFFGVALYDNQSGTPYKNCIGAASRTGGPVGPYTVATDPLLCKDTEDYLEPSVEFFNGFNMLYYSHVDNSSLADIQGRPLADDGFSFVAGKYDILAPTEDWEQIEGSGLRKPRVVKMSGYYYLFFNSGRSGIFIARADKGLGPYERQGAIPFLAPVGDRNPLFASVVYSAKLAEYVFLYTTVDNGNYNLNAKKVAVQMDLWPHLLE